MKNVLFAALFALISIPALASETRFELKDCGFTNSEIQAALVQVLVPALADQGVIVAPESLKVDDSPVPPRTIYTIDFGLAKRVTFTVISGEQLALENLKMWGMVDPELTHPAIFIQQGELQTFSDLGVKQADQCIASFPNGGIAMMFKNVTTQKSLPALAQKVRRKLAPSVGDLVFLSKDI